MVQTLVVVLVGLVLLLFQRRFSSGGGRPGRDHRPGTGSHGPIGRSRNPYQSVSISCGKVACQAARAKAGVRYLLGQTPLLPLEGCDVQRCDCRYAHHPDRRSALLDRRRAASLTTDTYSMNGERERRTHQGRRSTDRGWAAT